MKKFIKYYLTSDGVRVFFSTIGIPFFVYLSAFKMEGIPSIISTICFSLIEAGLILEGYIDYKKHENNK